MSRIQLLMTCCLVVTVYSSQPLNIDKARIGDSQNDVAFSSVMPFAVGHVSLACSPSGPGISTGSGGEISSAGRISSSLSESEASDVERFFLLKTTTTTQGEVTLRRLVA